MARSVFLIGELTEQKATTIIKEMNKYATESASDIEFIINTPGGSVSAMNAIIDTMTAIRCDVRTICFGQASSAGGILLLSGTKGKRAISKNSYVMLHHVISFWGGDESVLPVIEWFIDGFTKDIVDNTKMTKEDVETHLQKDFYIKADIAYQLGIVDMVF